MIVLLVIYFNKRTKMKKDIFKRVKYLNYLKNTTYGIMGDNMKFKIGDKVRVRSDLKVSEVYGMQGFFSDMIPLIGMLVEIEKITSYDAYHLKEDRFNYNWTDEMFEDELIQETKPIEVELPEKHTVACSHANKKKVQMILSSYWYCPDCKADLGDANKETTEDDIWKRY